MYRENHLNLVKEVVDEKDTFIKIRRHIHANPEIGAEVRETASFVAGLLAEWGYDVHTGVGGHGVVAQLRRGDSSRSIGIRAELDALPIDEATDAPYASCVAGRMHACGHDGHTASLLAAAHHLSRSTSFNGTLNLIFQPDEENLGGALRMLEDGLFDRFPCDVVFALHNAPGVPVGRAIIKEGTLSSASDIVIVTLTGVGGHCAMPDQVKDPIVAAGSLIMALQTIVSRNLAPQDVGVVSIGSITAGSVYNVIPASVRLLLNVRSSSGHVRELIEQRVREIVECQARAFGVDYSIEYQNLAPAVVNTQEATRLARSVAANVLGEENVLTDMKITTGSEDFAWMSQATSGCFILLGNGTGMLGGCMYHNPKYDFNDELIAVAGSYWVRLVQTYLSI